MRKRRFPEALAAGANVRRACAPVALSREAVYKLRQRDPVRGDVGYGVTDGALHPVRIVLGV